MTWIYQNRTGETIKEVTVTNLAPIRVGRTKIIPCRHDEDGASNFFLLSEDENGLWLTAAQGPGAGSAVPSS